MRLSGSCVCRGEISPCATQEPRGPTGDAVVAARETREGVKTDDPLAATVAGETRLKIRLLPPTNALTRRSARSSPDSK